VVLRFAYLPGPVPARKSFRLCVALGLVSALSVAGCASRAPTYVRAPVYEPSAQADAQATVGGYRQQHEQRRVEIEDDGMEAQVAPPLVRKREVDDPTEPFSPNYGRYTALKHADASGSPVYIPNDLPQEFRNKLAKASSGS